MNKHYTAVLTLTLMVAVFAVETYAQQGRGRQRGQQNRGQQSVGQRGSQQGKSQLGNLQNQIGGSVGNQLNLQERQGLALLREEEKLARDVYVALHAKWGDQVFANISRAESQHMSAVGNLLKRYGIPDPIKNDTPGVFVTAQFQQLYQSLVAAGSNSLIDAFKVGLKIEEMDIADLQKAMAATNNQDIRRVLGNLERGSRNHLRAFASRLVAVGGTYEATSLSQIEFNQIANSKQEPGNGGGQAGKSGQGMGAQNKGASQGQGQSRGQGQRSGRKQGQGKGRGR